MSEGPKSSIPDDLRRLRSLVPADPEEPPAPALADADVDAFEARTGVPVPDQLRDWLKFANGPRIGPGGLLGIRPDDPSSDIEHHWGLSPEWRAARWIPVAGDGCGNYYVLAPAGQFGAGNPVFFFEHEQSDPLRAQYAVGCDLWHFLRFLFRREMGDKGWPFDELHVVRQDPAILTCGRLPLPWHA